MARGNSDIAYQIVAEENPTMKASKLNPSSVKLG